MVQQRRAVLRIVYGDGLRRIPSCQMRTELSHLSMSARSRTAAGPRERGAGGQERYRESCARTTYTVALALLSLSFVPSVRAVEMFLCADEYVILQSIASVVYPKCVNLLHVVFVSHRIFELDSSPCRPVFASSPLHGEYLSTDTLGVPFSSPTSQETRICCSLQLLYP